MKKIKEFKKTVSEHFDNEALKSEEDNLHMYGSSTNDKFLKSPYLFIENFIEENSFKKVLDYCCGTGVYSIFPAKKCIEVHGIDISEKSIQTAIARAESFNVQDSCNFRVADGENIPYENECFDLVLSYGSLSYLNLDQAFAEINRVLSKDGVLIVVDSLGHNPIFNLNRKKNIMNYAPEYYDRLKTLKIEDLKLSSQNYFLIEKVHYFDFVSVLGAYMGKYLNKDFNPSLFTAIDEFLSKVPFLRRYFFKAVFVLKKI